MCVKLQKRKIFQQQKEFSDEFSEAKKSVSKSVLDYKKISCVDKDLVEKI